MSRTIVIASNNAGKIGEIERLLAPLAFNLIPQTQYTYPEADEPHPTFIENCLAKARHAAQFTGLAALADDSGICVTALGGAPGVHSARYAGTANGQDSRTTDQRNNDRLITALAGITQRDAYYYCVMVYLRDANDPQPLIAEGRWHGQIIDVARGNNGFGYDPHFFIPERNQTAAELNMTEKNAISHRGLALTRLVAQLRQL